MSLSQEFLVEISGIGGKTYANEDAVLTFITCLLFRVLQDIQCRQNHYTEH